MTDLYYEKCDFGKLNHLFLSIILYGISPRLLCFEF